MKLVNGPLLRKTWINTMCKELENIAQGYGSEKGTNAGCFLIRVKDVAIPKDRKMTYT